MIYRNKSLCADCLEYLPCRTTNKYCCSCIKTNSLNELPCMYCENQPLGEENKIDQEKLSQFRYEDYKKRLRQEVNRVWDDDYFDKQTGHYRKVSTWSICSKCQKPLEKAGHHGEVKQRYQTKFWELKTPYKVLCFNCLESFKNKMPVGKRYTFNKYLRRYNN